MKKFPFKNYKIIKFLWIFFFKPTVNKFTSFSFFSPQSCCDLLTVSSSTLDAKSLECHWQKCCSHWEIIKIHLKKRHWCKLDRGQLCVWAICRNSLLNDRIFFLPHLPFYRNPGDFIIQKSFKSVNFNHILIKNYSKLSFKIIVVKHVNVKGNTEI